MKQFRTINQAYCFISLKYLFILFYYFCFVVVETRSPCKFFFLNINYNIALLVRSLINNLNQKLKLNLKLN